MDYPTGVSFHTGATARSRRRLEERQMAVLREAGFEEVITPVIEYLPATAGGTSAEWIYRFPDQFSGRMLALRSDFTMQIAQLAAPRLREGEVRRFSYRGNAFRAVREHAGQQRQIFQVGAELLGDDSLDSTVTMLALAVKLLRAAGLTEFSLVVGHVGFVEHLLRLAALPAAREPDFREILRRKDLSGLEKLAREHGLDRERSELLRRAMYLFGREDALEEAARMLGDARGGVLADLRGILEGGSDLREHLLFDLTEPRGFEYYTGVMFQAVAPTIGQEVCRGGRYDNLLAGFGRPAPAVGFAVDLDLVLQAVEQHERYRRSDGTE